MTTFERVTRAIIEAFDHPDADLTEHGAKIFAAAAMEAILPPCFECGEHTSVFCPKCNPALKIVRVPVEPITYSDDN